MSIYPLMNKHVKRKMNSLLFSLMAHFRGQAIDQKPVRTGNYVGKAKSILINFLKHDSAAGAGYEKSEIWIKLFET